MPRTFNRVLNIHVQGEIYDSDDATPESIIRNYNWNFKNVEGEIRLTGYHKDNRGRISKMTILPKIHQWKSPSVELFSKL